MQKAETNLGTGVGSSKAERRAAEEFIQHAGYYCAGMIQERTSISQCHDQGLAANETKYNSINQVIEGLIMRINEKIHQLEEAYG